jgi:hypothetical protein
MLLASRNLGEGLINERQFAAIGETNSVLDIHKLEYIEAIKRGLEDLQTRVVRVRRRPDLKALSSGRRMLWVTVIKQVLTCTIWHIPSSFRK